MVDNRSEKQSRWELRGESSFVGLWSPGHWESGSFFLLHWQPASLSTSSGCPPSLRPLSVLPTREGYLGPWNVLVLGILLSIRLLGLGSSRRRPTYLGRGWGEGEQGNEFRHQDNWTTRHWRPTWPEERPCQRVRNFLHFLVAENLFSLEELGKSTLN